MSEGIVHERYILYATGATLLGSVLISDKIPLDLLVCANLGMISNVFVSPDYDQNSVVLPMYRITQVLTIWIPNSKFKYFIVDKITRIIQTLNAPYAIFMRHRSPFSHIPLLGTLIRWGYLYLMFWKVFLSSFYTFAELNQIVLNYHLNYTMIFLIFVVMGDFIHFALDDFDLTPQG